MNRRLVFRPQPLEEIDKAAEWYEDHGGNLSREFLRALDATVASVQRNPLHYPRVHKNVRRALLRRFPYSLVFVATDQEIVVLSCAHWRQDPSRWQDRG